MSTSSSLSPSFILLLMSLTISEKERQMREEKREQDKK